MKPMKLSFKDTRLLLICSAAILALTLFMFLVEFELDRPWKDYQRDFARIDQEITEKDLEKSAGMAEGPEKQETVTLLANRLERLETFSPHIKQVWLPHFGTADRCMSCHMGVELSRFEGAEKPFAAHPGNHINPQRHSVDNFGCVICHQGQDVALTVEEAHAETDIWLTPILRGELAEASCRRCHEYNDQVPLRYVFPDAPHLTSGKRLYEEKGCMGCHVLKSFEKPQRIAPILSRVSEKVSNGWMAQWINKPKEYLPLTIMPFFDLQEEQVQQLGAFLNSLPGQESAEGKIAGDVSSEKN